MTLTVLHEANSVAYQKNTQAPLRTARVGLACLHATASSEQFYYMNFSLIYYFTIDPF